MFFEGKVTTKPEEIRQWIETQGGYPAILIQQQGDATNEVLHVGFSECEQANHVIPISWDEFFDRLEAERLAFLYKDSQSLSDLHLRPGDTYHFL